MNLFRVNDRIHLLLILSFSIILASCATALDQIGSPASSGPLTLTDGVDVYQLGTHLEILEDPSGELGIEQVVSSEYDSQFASSNAEVPNFGFTDNVYWVRFGLENQTQGTEDWLLEQGFANTHYIDLYTPVLDSEGFTVKQTGVLRSLSSRDVYYPRIVFRMSVPIGSQQTIYMRFQSGASLTLPLTLWTQDAFQAKTQTEQSLHGLFYGILIGLLIYNLILYIISFREASTLYYVTFLLSFIFFISSYDGYTQIYLFPNLTYFAQYYIPLSFAAMIVSILLFANYFLEIQRQTPRIYQASILILGVWGLFVILTPFTNYHIMTLLMVPWALLSIMLVLIAGIVSLQRGFYAARFFMFAWSGLLVTLFLVMMVRFSLIPSIVFSENAFRLGALWMAVCWSIALAERINLLQSEKLASETRYRNLVETMNDGMGIVDVDGRFTYVNKRLVEMLAYSPYEITGHLAFEFMDRKNQQILDEQLELRKTGIGEPYELTWQKKDGSEIFTRVSPVSVFDNGNTFKGSFAVVTDITERVLAGRLLEQRIEERTQELSALLDISHDIISPSNLESTLNQILDRLQNILDFHRFVIVGDNQGMWTALAQTCPCLPADNNKVEFSEQEARAIVNDCSSKGPVIIQSTLAGGQNYSGFETIINKLSAGCDASIRCWLCVPLKEKDSMQGVLLFGCEQEVVSEDQNKIILAAANLVSMAIENSRLYTKLRESVLAEERNRLARDLHDSVTQTLFTASVLAEATPRIWDKDKWIARQNLEKLSRMIRGALAEMRSMLIELRLGELDEQTLHQMLHTLIEAVQGRSKILINGSIADISEIPKNVKSAYYRVAREALNNVIVHAAASRVDVLLAEKQGGLTLRIEDNGVGFNPQELDAGHLGLKIMEERAAAIGADLQILSEPGKGTQVILTWPMNPGIQDENG